MAPRPLLVLDGDSLAHRAYHGSRPLAGAGGRPINALHGFAIMAIGLWRAEMPRAVLACWDTLTVPTYRHEEWPQYQTGREFDPEILEQLDRMPELCEALGFAWAKGPGYEADDFLATATPTSSCPTGSRCSRRAPAGTRLTASIRPRWSSATRCCPSRCPTSLPF